MKIFIDEKDSIELAVALREIYEDVVFEGNELTNSFFTEAVMSAVQEQANADSQYFKEHPGQAFAYSSHDKLVTRFFEKINNVVDDTKNFVAREYSNAADIMLITVPYVISKLGIKNPEVALFSGIAIIISRIVIQNTLNQNNKKEEDLENDVEDEKKQ